MFIVALISTKDWSTFLVWLIVSGVYGGFLYLLCFKTTYTIDGDQLLIRIRWSTITIPVADIFHIRRDSYSSSGLRYGFAFTGLILVRQVKQVLFIAPAEEAAFVEALN